ncbi:MAG: ATP-binding protein [Atopobiaceae bacterium]
MEISRETIELLERVAPGYAGIYRIKGNSVHMMYASPNLHELSGMTAEEFERILADDARQALVVEDVPGLMRVVNRCLADHKPFEHYCRVLHKTLGFDWVHGNASYLGEYEGDAVILALFSNASVESNIYLRIIDSTERMVYICDRKNYEILYMNKAARGQRRGEYLGSTCYSYIRGRKTPCDDCFMNDIAYGEQLTTERLNESNGRWERLACEGIEWCGHDAFMQYIDDITEATTLKQQLQTAKDRYELAIESAELGVWEYHIQEHTITSPSKSFDKFGIMGTIADVPQSIVPLVVEEDRPKLLNLFRRLDAGERKVSEDIWMRWHPDAPLRCERVIYSLVEERDGKPAVAYGLGINVTLEKQEQQRYHELLQSLLVANPEALCAFELNLMRNTCGEGHGKSPFVMNLLSSSTADGLFRNVTAIIPSESDSDRFNAVFNRENLVRSFEEGRTSLSVDYHRLGEDGEPFWVRTYISMLRNPDTQDVTGIMYSVDISAEKRRDEIMNIITSQEYDLIALLHTDTDRFDAIFIGDSLPSGYRRFLPEAGASCSFSELCEYAAAHWVDETDRGPYAGAASAAFVRGKALSEERYEFTVLEHFDEGSGEGVRRRYQHYRLLDDPNAVLVVESDVTETYRLQQKALEQAKEEASRVQDILDTISGGICVLHMPDPDHLTIEYVNQQMFRLLGFSLSDNDLTLSPESQPALVNAYVRNAFVGVHPDDLERVKKTFHDNYNSRHFVVDDYRTEGADGAYYWIREEITLREVTPDHKVFYAVFTDVGEEVRLKEELRRQLEEEKLLRAQADAANASKSSFLSSVSHDMRTPLNGVLGYANLALESEDPAVVRDYLVKTKEAGKTLLSLINDTLDLSKIETGKLTLNKKVASCPQIMENVVTAIKPTMDAKDIDFTLDSERASGASINVDTLLLEKIILNLLNNATKFTPQHGHITMRVECIGREPGRIHDKITVSDDGVGMSREFLKKVFEPFAQERTEKTAHIGGSGLGLSIVKDIVDLMGGRIEVESELGHGTTFTVWLDFEEAEGAASGSAGKRDFQLPADALAGRRLLLVEDNEMNVEIARALLESRGAVVTRVENGREAVRAFRGAPGDFDAILMDIRMPVMDGYQAARAIRALDCERAASVPIIAMSADAYESDVLKSLDAGMNAHIAKPIDAQVMYRTIYEACNGVV